MSVHSAQVPVSPGDVFIISEDVFFKRHGHFVHAGKRTSQVMVVAYTTIPGEVIIRILKSSGVNADPVGAEFYKPVANLLKGRMIGKDSEMKLQKGGHLEGIDAEGKVIRLDTAKKGGMGKGASHAEDGIKGVVGTEKKPIEFEGEEIILTAPVSSDETDYEFEGKKMKAREIASYINQQNGGVAFAAGGDVPSSCRCMGKMYKWGGKSFSDKEIISDLNQKNQLAKGTAIEKKEHYDTLSKLNAGSITIDQAAREIAADHLKENPNYYNEY